MALLGHPLGATLHWALQSQADMDLAYQSWLSPAELARFVTLKSDKRRQDWLLGRWTVKRLAQTAIQQSDGVLIPLESLVIEPEASGAPRLRCALHPVRYHVSLSHSNGRVLGALASHAWTAALGADLEHIEPRSRAFLMDYFTSAEVTQVERAPSGMRHALATAIWSAKEAALKAVRLGLTVDTRVVECRLACEPEALNDWAPFDVGWVAHRVPGRLPPLGGWWRIIDDAVLTVAAFDPKRETL